MLVEQSCFQVCIFFSLATKGQLGKGFYRECMTTLSGRGYGSFSRINSMATPSMDDLICLMRTKAEARREEANEHRLKMAEMEQQQVVELRALGDIMTTLRLRERAREIARLQRMMESEDVESFLTTFEREM